MSSLQNFRVHVLRAAVPAVAGIVIAFSGSASAASVQWCTMSTTASFGQNRSSGTLGATINSSGSYVVENWPWTQNGQQEFPFSLSDSATAWADTTVGFNHLRVSARAMNSPQAYYYLDQYGTPQALDNNAVANATAHAESKWLDTITITSASLPKGTPVQLRTTFAIEGTGGADNISPFAGWDVTANLVLAGSAIAPAQLPAGWSYSYGYQYYGSSVGHSYTAATTFVIDSTVQVGSSYQIGVTLGGDAGASAGYLARIAPNYASVYPTLDPTLFASEANASVDASNTAYYGLDILTSDASYTSDSGHVYQVPEPSTMTLLGVGMAGIVLRRLRASA